MNLRIKIQMKKKIMIKKKEQELQECNKYKKKMMKKKQKEDMLIFINLEELLFNFYKKVEMSIKVV